MSRTRTTDGGALRSRSTSPLQRIAECMSAPTQADIHRRRNVATELGVDRHLWQGARALHRAHPDIFDVAVRWPDARQAEGLVRTFGRFKTINRKHAKTSRWQLASRLSPEAFVRLHLSATKALTPALHALPDRMLARAATMDADTLRAAFTCTGRNQYHPKPSAFFPGIAPPLDPQLITHQLDRQAEFLTELAACEQGDDQYGFLERWVTESPEAARRWVSTPRWKRPLLHTCALNKADACSADPEAHEIWESFKYLHGTLRGVFNNPDRPQRRSTEHPKAVGLVFQHYAKFTFQHRPRWYDVYWRFGFMLAHGKDVGDAWAPPWKRGDAAPGH